MSTSLLLSGTRPRDMRKTAWVWLAGCIAWSLDGLFRLHLGQRPHAELAFVMAALFGLAWGFYRKQ